MMDPECEICRAICLGFDVLFKIVGIAIVVWFIRELWSLLI